MLSNFNSLASTTPNADGTFRWDSVPPSEYRVVASGLPADYYVREIQLEQKDVLNKPFEFRGRESGSLEIVVGWGTFQIDGAVLDEKAKPAPGTMVVLIPD